MTHFDLTMLDHQPALLADHLSQKTGIKVLAASDDLLLDLNQALSEGMQKSL